MPERCWIHSSLESIASTTSALGTTRDGPVGADAEDRGVRGARCRWRWRPSGGPLRVEADQRLAGGDEVAVLDEPLDHLAAVRRR